MTHKNSPSKRNFVVLLIVNMVKNITCVADVVHIKHGELINQHPYLISICEIDFKLIFHPLGVLQRTENASHQHTHT
jgi:hypothetical protein